MSNKLDKANLISPWRIFVLGVGPAPGTRGAGLPKACVEQGSIFDSAAQ